MLHKELNLLYSPHGWQMILESKFYFYVIYYYLLSVSFLP